jgi:hypothetical protein
MERFSGSPTVAVSALMRRRPLTIWLIRPAHRLGQLALAHSGRSRNSLSRISPGCTGGMIVSAIIGPS